MNKIKSRHIWILVVLLMVLFDGGYAQASVTSATTDKFAFYFYNRDHLGNIREVVDASGKVKQATNYYPFGAPYADTSSSTNPDFQPYKYNGKELDRMHGLDTYDYGARQHDPILARWDRMDPLCEKYYNISPYVYCGNSPVMLVDIDGCKPDSLAAALMSALAYGPNSDYSNELVKIGWTEDDSYSTITGFKAKMFRKEIGKDKKGNAQYEYCLAFAGTDTENGMEFLKDGITDILNAVGMITPQYAEATSAAFGALLGKAKDSELTFVGHSLGGGLATLASKMTGRDAVIFNPASITGTIKCVANVVSFFRGGNITQYRADGDYVNAIQDAMRIPSSGKTHWINTGSMLSHGIDKIIHTFMNK